MRGKRAFDVALSLVVIAITSPLWTAAALLIRLTSAGPVFYRAVRVGKEGEPFKLLKFRTMRWEPGGSGSSITSRNDARVTGVGRILRRTKIDELPQLVNVLRGEMSLVGPRPEDPAFVARYTTAQRRVLAVRPGMTSPASIAFRAEESLLPVGIDDVDEFYAREILPAKLKLDLEYLESPSLWGDIRILMRTAFGLISRPRRRPTSPKA